MAVFIITALSIVMHFQYKVVKIVVLILWSCSLTSIISGLVDAEESEIYLAKGHFGWTIFIFKIIGKVSQY